MLCRRKDTNAAPADSLLTINAVFSNIFVTITTFVWIFHLSNSDLTTNSINGDWTSSVKLLRASSSGIRINIQNRLWDCLYAIVPVWFNFEKFYFVIGIQICPSFGGNNVSHRIWSKMLFALVLDFQMGEM